MLCIFFNAFTLLKFVLKTVLYPGLVPVENLSWMLFSGKDRFRSLVKTWQKDC